MTITRIILAGTLITSLSWSETGWGQTNNPTDVVLPPVPTVAEELPAPVAPSLQALAAAADQLQQALSRFRTGASWQEYLALPAFVFEPTVDDLVNQEILQATWQRYQQVAREARYQVIADLPEFQRVYHLLAAYLGQPVEPAHASPGGLRIGGRHGVQFGGGQGARFGGPRGVQFGAGQGARFGGPNGVQFGGGQGARFGGSGGVQFGGGQGVKIGPWRIGR